MPNAVNDYTCSVLTPSLSNAEGLTVRPDDAVSPTLAWGWQEGRGRKEGRGWKEKGRSNGGEREEEWRRIGRRIRKRKGG